MMNLLERQRGEAPSSDHTVDGINRGACITMMQLSDHVVLSPIGFSIRHC